MFDIRPGADGVHLGTETLGAAQHIDTYVEAACHRMVLVEGACDGLGEVGALAAHPFLDVEPLALGSQTPALVDVGTLERHVAQTVVVVRVVLVIEAALEFEAAGRYVGDDPFLLPLRPGSLADGPGSLHEGWVFLVAFGDGGGQSGLDIGVGSLGGEVGGGQVLGLVEDEADGPARRELGKGSRIVATGRVGLILELIFLIGDLVFEALDTMLLVVRLVTGSGLLLCVVVGASWCVFWVDDRLGVRGGQRGRHCLWAFCRGRCVGTSGSSTVTLTPSGSKVL